MALALLACSSGMGPTAVQDASSDASFDASFDASLDAAVAGAMDAVAIDAEPDASVPADATTADAGTGCEVFGAPGQCVSTSSCAAIGDHTSYAGHCAGPADIECCIKTPSVADNPPVPAGWKLMAQADVTSDMTTWAVSILNDPVTYPMFSTTIRTFGTLMVMARVEWHPPDFNNGVVHRGVTLYQPI
jgi:hypothetical protein